MTHNTYSQLLSLLNRGEELSYDQAKGKLGLLSRRQVQRIIARMKSDGIPICTRKEGHRLVFYLDEEHREPEIRVALSEEQLFALSVVVGASKATFASTPFGLSLRTAFTNFLNKLPGEVFSFEESEAHCFGGIGNSIPATLDPAVFSHIAHAVAECRRLKIAYVSHGNKSWPYGYHIDPYGLAVHNGSWTLVAFCRERMDICEFVLADITRIEQTAELFFRPTDFDVSAYFHNRFSAHHNTPTYAVRLLVESRFAHHFRRNMFHHSQDIEEKREDGSIIVSYTVEGLQWIRSFVQSWGAGVAALEPEELRLALLHELHQMLVRYGDMSESGHIH